jgi:hypothetical protein
MILICLLKLKGNARFKKKLKNLTTLYSCVVLLSYKYEREENICFQLQMMMMY